MSRRFRGSSNLNTMPFDITEKIKTLSLERKKQAAGFHLRCQFTKDDINPLQHNLFISFGDPYSRLAKEVLPVLIQEPLIHSEIVFEPWETTTKLDDWNETEETIITIIKTNFSLPMQHDYVPDRTVISVVESVVNTFIHAGRHFGYDFQVESKTLRIGGINPSCDIIIRKNINVSGLTQTNKEMKR